MTRRLLVTYLCVTFLVAPYSFGQDRPLKDPPLNRIALHPDQYLGKTVIFRNVWLSGGSFRREIDTTHNEDIILFGVKSDIDGYHSPILTSDGIAFITSERIGDKLMAQVRGDYNFQAEVTGTIDKVRTKNGEYVVVRVSKVKFGLLNTVK